jgi:hypothetical protein
VVPEQAIAPGVMSQQLSQQLQISYFSIDSYSKLVALLIKVFFNPFLICVLTVSGYRFYALIFHEYCLIHVHDISFLEVETNISIVLTQTYRCYS